MTPDEGHRREHRTRVPVLRLRQPLLRGRGRLHPLPRAGLPQAGHAVGADRRQDAPSRRRQAGRWPGPHRRRHARARRPRARPVLAAGHLPFLLHRGRRSPHRGGGADSTPTAVLLRERYGVTTGDRVAIVAANHAEYAILMWAVVTLGAIVTSLSGWWTAPELEYGIS